MSHYYQEREKYITLGLSLLVHIIFILILLHITHQQSLLLQKKILSHEITSPNQPISLNQTTLNADDPLSLPAAPTVAALKPRASSFGVPHTFQEEPEYEPTLFDPHAQDLSSQEASNNESQQEIGDKKTETEQEQKNQEQAEKFEAAKQESTQEPEQTAAHAEESEEIKQTEKAEQPITQSAAQPEQLEEQPALPGEKNNLSEVQESEKNALAEEKVTPQKNIVFQEVSLSQAPSAPRASRKMPERPGKSAGPIRRTPTFADLANGFISSIKNEGQDWLERDGDPNKRPDMKELRYLSYVQKLVWYMQNEWRATQEKVKNLRFTQDLTLALIITILKDGTFGGIQIVQPSGSDELDSFLIKGIKNASPYPPVPHYLNDESFDLPLAIHNGLGENSPWKMRLANGPMHTP